MCHSMFATKHRVMHVASIQHQDAGHLLEQSEHAGAQIGKVAAKVRKTLLDACTCSCMLKGKQNM